MGRGRISGSSISLKAFGASEPITGDITLIGAGGLSITQNVLTREITFTGGGGAGANTSLSNLASPTAINQALTFGSGVNGALYTKENLAGATTFIEVKTGDATGGLSGSVYVYSGASDVATGSVEIFSSDGPSSGLVYLKSGSGTTNGSGSCTLGTGQGVTASGQVFLSTGDASAGSSGSLNIFTGGASGGGNNSGTMLFTTGASAAAASGAFTLKTGDGSTASGNIVIQTGTGATRGTVTLDGSQSFSNSDFLPSVTNSYSLGTTSNRWVNVFATTYQGATISFSTLAAGGGISGGTATSSSGTTVTGGISFTSGAKIAGTGGGSGAITIASGTASVGVSGAVSITSGTSNGGTSGTITIASGGNGGSSVTTGAVTIQSGNSTSGSSSGVVTITSGSVSVGGSASGNVNINTGGNSAGTGTINIITGSSGGSFSGAINLTTGTMNGGASSGAINLTTGSGAGTRGVITMNASTITVTSASGTITLDASGGTISLNGNLVYQNAAGVKQITIASNAAASRALSIFAGSNASGVAANTLTLQSGNSSGGTNVQGGNLLLATGQGTGNNGNTTMTFQLSDPVASGTGSHASSGAGVVYQVPTSTQFIATFSSPFSTTNSFRIEVNNSASGSPTILGMSTAATGANQGLRIQGSTTTYSPGGTDTNGKEFSLRSTTATGNGFSTIDFYGVTPNQGTGTTIRTPVHVCSVRGDALYPANDVTQNLGLTTNRWNTGFFRQLNDSADVKVVDIAGRALMAGGNNILAWQGGPQVKIGVGGFTTSAALEIDSTVGALLVPRMTTAQKNALTAANGMIVYDTDLGKFQGYEAGAWTSFI